MTHFGTLVLLGWFGLLNKNVLACSRVTYHAQVNDRIAIGRSMDFVASTNSSIFTFPAGQNRTGCSDANPLRWTSKYGSIVTTMYDAISIDGMNSEGLTGSVLYLGQSDYGERNASTPGLAIGLWLQYFLDMYATVDDAATDLKKNLNLFQVITQPLVPGVSSTGHVSITDKSGDNMVMEYLDGKLVIHHGEEYQVMTNDPTFDEQLALNTYWKPIANQSLPGTSTPAGQSVITYLDQACFLFSLLFADFYRF
jgi:penicillin V acylase-like amidase (Ntn superfamily)